MSDMLPESRKPMPAHKDAVSARVEKINKVVDKEIEKIFDDLDIFSSDLDALISILKDRMIESTEASFPIALARLGELRMDTVKKRIEIIKTLVTDKSIEVQSKKKTNSGDLESILSGAGLGIALGAHLGKSNYGNSSPAVISNEFETINTEDIEVIVETEHLNLNNVLEEKDIDSLLGDE